jgi:hypothetical protein
MSKPPTHALSDILDRLERLADGAELAISDVVDAMGSSSFASLMLVFALIAASPASTIPGITAVVAVIEFTLVVQMIFGRSSVWLPSFITRRHIATDKLRKGVDWLRKPVGFVERFLKPRLTLLFHRPWKWLPLILIVLLTLFMPFMELIPSSGSIAATVIALYAASLLTRDGVLAILSIALLMIIPVLVWQFAPGL